MTYIAGGDEFSFRLTSIDVDIMNLLVKKGFGAEVEAILGVSDFDQESPEERVILLESIDKILEAIKIDSKILPYIYYFKIEMPPGSGFYTQGSGMASGIRINKELYSIEGGLDRCKLTKDLWDEAGNHHEGETKDIRELKSIKTDSHGEIAILKRRKPTCLVRNLKKLKEFLRKKNDDIIQKVLL